MRCVKTTFLILIAIFATSSLFAFDKVYLEKSIAGNDKESVHGIFNEIIEKGQYQPELEYFAALYRNIPGNSLRDSEVLAKLHSLNVLLQAERNGYAVREDILSEGHGYALGKVQYDYDAISRTAIQVVAIYDQSDGFSELLKLAENENSPLFRSLISGIVEMCDSFDKDAYDNFLASVSSENRDIAEEIRLNFINFDQEVGWCP